MRGTRTAVLASGLAVVAAGLYFGVPRPKEIRVPAHVRINQAGYGIGREQRAYLLAAGPAEGGTFEVRDIATTGWCITARWAPAPDRGAPPTLTCTRSTSGR